MTKNYQIKVGFTPEERRLVEIEARAKGMTPSAFLKYCTFTMMNRYAGNGVFKELYERMYPEVPEREKDGTGEQDMSAAGRKQKGGE